MKRHRVRDSNQHARTGLKALGLSDCNPLPTPSSNSSLPYSTEELDQEAAYLYRSCVGFLLYLSHDRPDIMWEIGLLSSKMSSPTEGDQKRLARDAHYLKGTMNVGVRFRVSARRKPRGDRSPVTLKGWSDANWASTETERKSVSCGAIQADGCVLYTLPFASQ